MAHISLIERVRALAEPLAESLGLMVWGIEFSGGARGVLRVYVDASPYAEAECGAAREAGEGAAGEDGPARAPEDAALPPGVTIDQCGEFSRLLGASLEVEDVMSGAYILEVSSPGLERPFFCAAQLHPYIGAPVELVLSAPSPDFPGRRNFRGVLADAPRRGGDGPIAVVPDCMALPAPTGAKRLVFSWNDVKRMRLVHIFPEPRKPGKR